jgi:hypothetical protein
MDYGISVGWLPENAKTEPICTIFYVNIKEILSFISFYFYSKPGNLI